MELLEIIKGNGRFAREYKADKYPVKLEMSLSHSPISRRRIDYKVVLKDGRKYWEEVGRYEFVHSAMFSGEWKQCENGWIHSDEELIAMTRVERSS